LYVVLGTGTRVPGYPGCYPLPGYPVRTRVPGNFYYLVAVHSTLSFRLQIWCNWQHLS